MSGQKPRSNPSPPTSGQRRGPPRQPGPTLPEPEARAEPGTPCRPAKRTEQHATRKSVWERGTHRTTQRCAAGALARAGRARPRNGQAVSQRETLDKPGCPARRGTVEQAAQSEMRSELYNNNETPSWLGHASTRFGKEVKCQRKTGGGAITAPPTNQRSGDPRPIADTSGQYSGAQGLETLGPSHQTLGS